MADYTGFLTTLSVEQQRLFQLKLQQLHAQKGHAPARVGIGQRRQANDLPLSYAQQRFFFLEQLEPNTPDHILPATLHMRGQLQLPALVESLNLLVQRHEILRTSFPTRQGVPVQHISPAQPLVLALEDLSDLSAEQAQARLAELIAQQQTEPFELSSGALWRVALVRLAAEEHVLLVAMHHIITDGWSSSVLVSEVSQAYAALVQGKQPQLSELAIQYGDYAVWQQEWLVGEQAAQQMSYWREQLGQSENYLNLPLDRPRQTNHGFRSGNVTVLLPRDLVGGLILFSQQENGSLFMAMLAGYAILLARYCGQPNINIGTYNANRNRPELEGLIGFFLNTLVLRMELGGDLSPRAVIRQARQVCLTAYQNQDTPFEKILEAVRPERDRGHAPLFQVMLVMQNLPDRTLRLPDLELQLIPGENMRANADLTLWLYETEQGLTASLEYNRDLFDQPTIGRLLEHYQLVLRAMLAQPDRPIRSFCLLTEQETELMLRRWNATDQDYPATLVHGLFEAQAARTPDAPALIYNGECLSYQELDRRATQLALSLRSCNVDLEVPVAVYLDRSFNAVIAQIGILKAGGVCLPLDEYSPPERHIAMLRDANVTIMITLRRLSERFAAYPMTTICLDEPLPPPAAGPLPELHPDNLALIIYTSGSTGMPKGVMISHGNFCNYAFFFAQRYRLPTTISAHLQMASIAFDVFFADMLRALGTGARLVICPRETMLDPAALYAFMRQEQIDSAEFVPAVLKLLAEYLAETGQSLDFMRLLAAGADTWRTADYELVRQLVGPETRLLNVYGLTEATIDNTHWAGDAAPQTLDGVMPIGWAIANTHLYVLDRWLNPVPIGVVGELCVGGAGVGRGYFRHPTLTAERFIPDPFSGQPGACLYRSGDAVRFTADGMVEFLGRIDQQVKIRGFRIELGEIESQLQEHPQVKSAVVIARHGPATVYLIAYIVLHPQPDGLPANEASIIQDIHDFLQVRLPDYMVPGAYVFLDQLPLTANKKIDRRALLQSAAQPIEVRRAYEPPTSPTEQAVAQIWARLTGVERVGLHDNFFELGGHSLLLARMVAEIRETFQVTLQLRDIFVDATVANVVVVIEQAQKAARQLAATDEERLGLLVENLSEEQVNALLNSMLGVRP